MNLLNCLKISREIAGKKCVQIMKIPGGFDHNVLCLQALTTFFERVSNPSLTHSEIFSYNFGSDHKIIALFNCCKLVFCYQNCSSDREKLLKFEAEGRVFLDH